MTPNEKEVRRVSDLLWPVFEIRPLPGEFRQGECFRYADGGWIPDDGEWDMVFAGRSSDGFPLVLGVDLPYQRNIVWKWLTCHWAQNIPAHPGGNPWHYALRDGATNWGGDWERDRHPNRKVHDAGMGWLAGRHGCANGRGFDFTPYDPHLLAGLIRNAETKVTLDAPTELTCMYGCVWTPGSHGVDS